MFMWNTYLCWCYLSIQCHLPITSSHHKRDLIVGMAPTVWLFVYTFDVNRCKYTRWAGIFNTTPQAKKRKNNEKYKKINRHSGECPLNWPQKHREPLPLPTPHSASNRVIFVHGAFGFPGGWYRNWTWGGLTLHSCSTWGTICDVRQEELAENHGD